MGASVTCAESTVTGTTHGRVCAGLKADLMNGEYLPGQRIVVREVAERFKTSAMPVREALRQLVSDEALFDHPNRGVIVPEASVALIDDLTRVRCSIEGAATEWAAATVSMAELDSIRTINDRMKDCALRREAADYLVLNRTFHFTIYRAAGSEVLMPIIERLWLRIGPWLNLLRDEASLSMGLEHHAGIIEALLRGDGLQARRALVADLSDAADIMLRAISKSRLAHAPTIPGRREQRARGGATSEM